MGSWNDSCAITRQPIWAGQPVVALRVVRGPKFFGRAGVDVALFGFIERGEYDDYGGIENLRNEPVAEFNEKALRASPLYQTVVVKGSSGDSVMKVARGAAIDMLEDSLRPLFMPKGSRPSVMDSHAPEDQDVTMTAFRAARAALKQLGAKLDIATYREGTRNEVRDQVFDIVREVFGDDKAWAAWDALRRNGLFAIDRPLLIHESAWRAVVDAFGKRRATCGKLRMPARALMDRLLQQYRERLVEQGPSGQLSRFKQRPLSVSGGQFEMLAPLTYPWGVSDMPILSAHVWGGATTEEVLEAVPHNELLDLLVFQWAAGFMRTPLVVAESGSQNCEAALLDGAHKAVMKTLAAGKRPIRNLSDLHIFS